jgi:hypothetical protein
MLSLGLLGLVLNIFHGPTIGMFHLRFGTKHQAPVMANIVQCGATLKKVLAKPSHFQFQDVPVGEHLPVTPNGSLKAKSHPPNVLERVRFSHILFLPHSAMPNGFAKPGDCRLICGMLSLMTIAPVTHVLFGVRSLGLLVLPPILLDGGKFLCFELKEPQLTFRGFHQLTSVPLPF